MTKGQEHSRISSIRCIPIEDFLKLIETSAANYNYTKLQTFNEKINKSYF